MDASQDVIPWTSRMDVHTEVTHRRYARTLRTDVTTDVTLQVRRRDAARRARRRAVHVGRPRRRRLAHGQPPSAGGGQRDVGGAQGRVRTEVAEVAEVAPESLVAWSWPPDVTVCRPAQCVCLTPEACLAPGPRCQDRCETYRMAPRISLYFARENSTSRA